MNGSGCKIQDHLPFSQEVGAYDRGGHGGHDKIGFLNGQIWESQMQFNRAHCLDRCVVCCDELNGRARLESSPFSKG